MQATHNQLNSQPAANVVIPPGTDFNVPKNMVSQNWDAGQMGHADEKPFVGFSEEIIHNLPLPLQEACQQFTTTQDQGTFLVSAIGVISGLLPNVIGFYDGRTVGPNLYVFVVAPFGTGKGGLEYARQLGMSVHKHKRELFESEKKEYQLQLHQYEQALQAFKKNKAPAEAAPVPPKRPPNQMLFIPANSSKTAIIQAIAENDGRGLLFENEGDTLADAVRQDYGNFSDVLRKAAHHEPVNLLRRGNDGEYIEVLSPHLSLVLSSTFGQLLNLIPNAENGLFSRFIFFQLNATPEFKNVFDQRKSDYGTFFSQQGDYYQKLYNTLNNRKPDDPVQFALTLEQQDRFWSFFQEMKRETVENVGLDFAGSVNRLGLIFFRICMVLSFLRAYSETDRLPQYISCTDTDFTNAMRIIAILKLHALSIYWQLPKAKIKSLDEENDETKLEQKRRCRELHKTGHTYRQIAELVLGSASKRQTVYRWCQL
ncbi:hypothetical protein GCM10028773_58300 [Spirosoma koreense]